MKDYIEKAMRTNASPDGPLSRILQEPEYIDYIHMALGVCSEAGEIADLIKKCVFYGADFDNANLLEEVGDSLWYHAMGLEKIKKTFSDAMNVNINKLEKRYHGKFTEEDALNRNLKEERKILEDGLK